MNPRAFGLVTSLVVLCAVPAVSAAQCADSVTVWQACRGTLIRSAADRPDDSVRARRILVDARPWSFDGTWNSQLPFSMNDGARWAGRGLSSTISSGVRIRWRAVRVVLAPELIDVRNTPFLTLPPDTASGLDPYANPWHAGAFRIDQPLRLGASPTSELWWGQSIVEFSGRGFGVGASTEDLWWGPGVRNALVMSNNAGGFPHVFARTTRPLVTSFGRFEGRYSLGALTESRFFDTDASNDTRSLSAIVLTWRPVFDSALTIGFARAVIGTVPRPTAVGAHVADAFASRSESGRDQIQSLFARWEFPAANLEVHGEWARLRFPSFREWLVGPHRTQGYTLGLQWLQDGSFTDLRFGVAAEATTVEQPIPGDRSESPGFYVSSRVPQGFTQHGQIIGAAIGSGGSSQWLHAYAVRNRALLGPVLGRIRWENESYYRQFSGTGFTSHDVSLFGGLRSQIGMRRADLNLEWLRIQRLNYLFQTVTGPGWSRAFDSRGTTLNFSATLHR